MREFSLLIKPASADCNLRCEYCFYLEKGELYPGTDRHRMPDAVLARLVESYEATEQPQYAFGWQGGEPALMGVEFFRAAVEYQKKFGRGGAVVANGLQTNATLITDELAALFAEYRFLLGVSLDGPPRVHDAYRLDAAGAGSHARVRAGIKTLRRHGVEFNILNLVSKANVDRPESIYKYLVGRGFHHHQYIPCAEADAAGEPLPYSITGEEWGGFLCRLFDLWRRRDIRRVSIRLFDAVLALLVDGRRNLCRLDRNCNRYFVVEYNGDVYPCDFFVCPELRLGNIMEDSWDELARRRAYLDFGACKSRWSRVCDGCEWLEICAGDCLKRRLYGPGSDPGRLSVLCAGWKRFFEHSMPVFEELAALIRRERASGGP